MKEIEALREDFYRAHYNTSFSPDVRADQCVREFSAELEADLAELGDRAGDYAAKYVANLRAWAGRKSRCLSAMITGPANFPTARNRKAMNAEESAWKEFRAWRDRYIKRAFREPTKSPEEEIDDALLKLEKQRNLHEVMLGINKILRKKVSDGEKRKMLANVYEYSEATINKLMTPDPWYGLGFAPFVLTNSNARIKSLEEKVIVMKKRIEARDSFESISFPGGTISIEDDRVVIRHDERPTAETIDALKSRGFHWSPKGQFWCRKHTANALRDAKAICGVSA